jgi:hypothetical protein
VPFSLKQHGSSCIYNKTQSDTFNCVAAVKLHIWFQKSKKAFSKLLKTVLKMPICVFTILFRNGNKIGCSKK